MQHLKDVRGKGHDLTAMTEPHDLGQS